MGKLSKEDLLNKIDYLEKGLTDLKELVISIQEIKEVQPERQVVDIYETLELQKLYDKGIKGEGVKVAIIDDGFKQFEGILEYKNIYSSKHVYVEKYGHGTRVAGLVKDIAPNCELYACETLSECSVKQLESIIDCLNWCINNDIDVINISQGYTLQLIDNFYDDVLKKLERKLEEVKNKGIVVCCAAGNNGYKEDIECVTVPAQYSSTIAVGSVNNKLEWSKFSSTGKTVDVVSFGEDIETIAENGTKRKCIYGGTSLASPIVSGLVALMKQQNSSISKDDVIALFKQTALDLGTIGKDKAYGYGLAKAIEIPNNYVLIGTVEESKPNFLLDNLNVKQLHKAGYKGEGIKIAIAGYGCSNLKEFNVKEYIDLSGENKKWATPMDPIGNVMTSIISSIAPESELYELRENTEKGWQMYDAANRCSNWCLKNKMDIAILPIYTPKDTIKKLNDMGTIVLLPSFKNQDVGTLGVSSVDTEYALTISFVDTNGNYITGDKRHIALEGDFVDFAGYAYGMEYLNSKGEKEIFDKEEMKGSMWRAYTAESQVAGVLALLKQQDKTLNNAIKIRNLFKGQKRNNKTGYGILKAKLL